MPESQSIEYKLSWRDEYLKWICAFANAQGGKLYICIDDKDVVTGISESKNCWENILHGLATSVLPKYFSKPALLKYGDEVLPK